MSQLYVFQCVRDEASLGRRSNLFGSKSKYKKGDYVSYFGEPTSKINEATINTLEEYNPLKENNLLAEHFKAIKVKIAKLND